MYLFEVMIIVLCKCSRDHLTNLNNSQLLFALRKCVGELKDRRSQLKLRHGVLNSGVRLVAVMGHRCGKVEIEGNAGISVPDQLLGLVVEQFGKVSIVGDVGKDHFAVLAKRPAGRWPRRNL